MSSRLGPEFWPGNVALSWLMLVIDQDIWTFDKVVLVSLSWVMLEAQDLWSHLFAFDANLSLVDHEGRYTASWTSTHIPEVNCQLIKTDWRSIYAYNPTFIISGVIHAGHKKSFKVITVDVSYSSRQ